MVIEREALRVLREARELITPPENWTCGMLARMAQGDERDIDPTDLRATCWCASGAIQRCVETVSAPDRNGVSIYLNAALYIVLTERWGARWLHRVNDDRGHEAALQVLDQTIERIEARLGGE